MPRRRVSRVSISSEHSTNSDQSDNVNIIDELPDPVPTKTNCKDAKEKKKVSFNFPVEVITKTGNYSGIGTIDLLDTLASLGPAFKPRRRAAAPTALERSAKLKNTIAELKDVLSNLKNYAPEKKKQVKNEGPKNKKKPPPVEHRTNKKDAAKEAAREAKEAKKREVEAEKEAAKKVVEDEKAAKAEFEEHNKIYKPGECLKYITIEVHPELASAWFMADTVRETGALGVRVLPEDTICDASLLVWTRRVLPTLASEDGQVKLSATKLQCPRALYILTGEELAALPAAAAHVAHMRALVDTPLSLLILAPPSTKNRSNSSQRMSREKFTKTVADLQIELTVPHKIDLLVVETPMELAMIIVHFTRAIAEAPYKKAKRNIDEQAQFYMRGDNKNCVTVDKDGNGLSRLWEQMIAVLPQSSLEVARTLGAEYKNPSALFQEFQRTRGMSKVADIGVARTNVPGAKTRRLGPEFARKLHILFTTEDGNTVVE